MYRRDLLKGAGALALLAGTTAIWQFGMKAKAVAETFEITKTDEEWKAILTPEAYAVLRHEDTEYPGTSPLLNEKRKGTFACAGCDLPLYASETKYDSGTGWPSFWEALPNAVASKDDSSLGMMRVECHCRRCGGHLGHIFDDGPPPTGKRHCINGVSLQFHAAAA
jgi:peptide-methionine (R)-S-oxide reductase